MGYRGNPFRSTYDVTADDQRFVMIHELGLVVNEGDALILVENFFEELKAKVGN